MKLDERGGVSATGESPAVAELCISRFFSVESEDGSA